MKERQLKPEEFIKMMKQGKQRAKLRDSFEAAMSSILGGHDVTGNEDASPPPRFNPFYRSQSPLPAKSNNQTPTDMSPRNMIPPSDSH